MLEAFLTQDQRRAAADSPVSSTRAVPVLCLAARLVMYDVRLLETTANHIQHENSRQVAFSLLTCEQHQGSARAAHGRQVCERAHRDHALAHTMGQGLRVQG